MYVENTEEFMSVPNVQKRLINGLTQRIKRGFKDKILQPEDANRPYSDLVQIMDISASKRIAAGAQQLL